MSRCVVVFGQFGAAADPANLPAFNARLLAAGIETILIQHDDTKSAVDFLGTYVGPVALVGASLGAMSVIVFANYLRRSIAFAGGFQPSDFDPSGHDVLIKEPGGDVITRAITVPRTIAEALCFRNPILAATGGFGHATWIKDPDNSHTQLTVIERVDPHPGDFGEAADMMFDRVTKALQIGGQGK